LRGILKKFINHSITESVVGLLIVACVYLTILEFKLPNHPWNSYFSELATIINWLFVAELLIRFYVERDKSDFFKSYWIDVIAVLPVSKGLRVLRIFRLLRLIRLGVLVTRRTRRLTAKVSSNLAENLLIVVTLFIVFLIGAIGMNLAEKSMGPEDALWYSLFTLMGGEPIMGMPTTPVGKVITMVVMLGGFTMFAIFTGVVSALMIERLRGGMDGKDLDLDDLRGHYVICGWNRVGVTIIKELQSNQETTLIPVVVAAELEREPLLPDGIDQRRVLFFQGDFTSTETLGKVRISEARRAILLADKSKQRSDQDRDARTILAALTIEKIHANGGTDFSKIYTCVELLNMDRHKVKLLEMAGVEDIIEGDEYIGNLMAHTTRAHGLAKIIDELLTSDKGNEFIRTEMPGQFAGKTFGDALLEHKRQTGELIIAVVRCSNDPDNGGKCVCDVNPASDRVLLKDEELISLGWRGKAETRSVRRTSGEWLCSLPGNFDGLSKNLKTVEDHLIICGWNRAAPKIVRELRRNNQTKHAAIVLIAEIAELPPDCADIRADPLAFFISGDYTTTKVLEQARVSRAASAILLADKSVARSDQDRDARTILAALTIEKMNVDIHSCVELLNRDKAKAKLLEMANVEAMVVGDEYMGNLIAHASRTNGLIQVLDELLRSSEGNQFVKMPVGALAGKTFIEAVSAVKQQFGALPMAIETLSPGKDEKHGSVKYITNPAAGHVLEADDYLFVLARDIHEIS